ncbi:winged helix-turn-helix transcriptional regulator [Roseibium sp.]|uniref:winged helix-turn-helix transcriptional regulator n=1 Tax=Roseibium sp. TaxID=1936156 RepID=UPI003A985938
MDIATFVNLTSRAWALPILSCLHDGVPGRQAPLLSAIGASRTAFAQSMEHLIRSGFLERNPGHGHPLRPEFRLTPAGKDAAAMAHKIQTVAAIDDLILLRRSWTLPVLTSLHQPKQFTEIRRNLTTITDRALSQSLKSMEDRNWVQRRVIDEVRPPRPIYSAINLGSAISQITGPQVSFAENNRR